MKEIYKLLEIKPIKPSIWNHNIRILNDKKHAIKTLVPFTPQEKYLIFKRKIIALKPKHNKTTEGQKKTEIKNTKCDDTVKDNGNMKNSMISNDKNTVKDSANNPSTDSKNVNIDNKDAIKDNSTVKEITSEMWLIKTRNNLIKGPYTRNEIKKIIEDNYDEDMYLKRDSDKYFMDYRNIKELVGGCINFDKLNEIFDKNEEHTEIEEGLKNTKIENSMPRQIENHKPFVNKVRIKEVQKFLECDNFLNSRSCTVKIDDIIRKVYGKSRGSSINIIGFMTNLNLKDSEKLVSLIVKTTGNEIIADEKGFVKAVKKVSKK